MGVEDSEERGMVGVGSRVRGGVRRGVGDRVETNSVLVG